MIKGGKFLERRLHLKPLLFMPRACFLSAENRFFENVRRFFLFILSKGHILLKRETST